MNYFETPSGIKFVLNTDLNIVANPRELLQQIYENVCLFLTSLLNNNILKFYYPIGFKPLHY